MRQHFRKMKKWIAKKIFGNIYSQEYLCLSRPPDEPLRTVISGNDIPSCDVSGTHLFFGYKPLIMGLVAAHNSPHEHVLRDAETLHLRFQSDRHGTVARLTLQLMETLDFGAVSLLLYKGKSGAHRFMPFHQKLANSLRYSVQRLKKMDGHLPSNLYDQVRIAYAIPRKIRIITVGMENKYNLFPTDLHGAAGNGHYVISLRKEGKACRQVNEAGKIALSYIRPEFYQRAYALGKNHMRDLRPADEFPVSGYKSTILGLPLPESTTAYFELELYDTRPIGIHQLHCFRILNHQPMDFEADELTHIHAYYANWRHRKGLNTEILVR